MDTTQLSHIDVLYIPGKTIYGALPARLEWAPDNTVSLTTVEGTPEAPVYTKLFSGSVGDIKKVASMLDELKITTTTGTYRVSVAQHSTPAIAAGGVPGLAIGYGMYKKSGADAWLQRFKDQGVQVSRVGYGALFGIALLTAGILIAITFGIFLLMEK